MMNGISRLITFTFAAAAIATAHGAQAQQVAAEAVAPAACMNRSAPASPQAAVDGNKNSAGKADSKAEEIPALEITTDGLVRRTSLSVERTADEGLNPRPQVEVELSSRPQACYPPAPLRKAVDR